MRSYAQVVFVWVVVTVAVQSQTCIDDPRAGAFEFSDLCRPIRDKRGVRYGEVCADTKLDENADDNVSPDLRLGFFPSCLRLKFRADEGYQLNKLRGGAHFNEPPEKQARFTSYRDIDRWKDDKGIVDPISVARLLVCPDELAGRSDCCGEDVSVVGYAIVSSITDGQPIRAFLGEENDEDDLCTTREEDNTTSCKISISCPPCGGDQCRGLGGACQPLTQPFCSSFAVRI